jgi:hypothetical protein
MSTCILIQQNEVYLVLIGCSFGFVSSYCVEWSTMYSATSWPDFRSMHRDHKSCEQCVHSHCYQISARVLWQWIQNRFLVNLFWYQLNVTTDSHIQTGHNVTANTLLGLEHCMFPLHVFHIFLMSAAAWILHFTSSVLFAAYYCGTP